MTLWFGRFCGPKMPDNKSGTGFIYEGLFFFKKTKQKKKKTVQCPGFSEIRILIHVEKKS